MDRWIDVQVIDLTGALACTCVLDTLGYNCCINEETAVSMNAWYMDLIY